MSIGKSTAALLIAHGSRRDEANDDLRRLADAVRAEGAYDIIEIAYLELAAPSIPEGARRCIERGAQRVLMLPYFLSSGRHVNGDLEGFRTELSAEFPHVQFRLCEPLGLHPKLVEVVLERLAKGADDPRP